MAQWYEKLYDWLDERLDIKPFTQRFFHPVPKWVTWTYCFGGVAFVLLLIQLVSGIYLTFFYVPSPDRAWDSVLQIEGQAAGHFLRSVHRWGAGLMVATIALHILRVIYHGAFRPPRELNWWTGIILLVTAFAFVYSGYLLPWDIRSYWALLVTINALDQIPLAGPAFKNILLGSAPFGMVPLGRFFSFHVLLFPLAIGVLLTFHFIMVRRQGVSRPL